MLPSKKSVSGKNNCNLIFIFVKVRGLIADANTIRQMENREGSIEGDALRTETCRNNELKCLKRNKGVKRTT